LLLSDGIVLRRLPFLLPWRPFHIGLLPLQQVLSIPEPSGEVLVHLLLDVVQDQVLIGLHQQFVVFEHGLASDDLEDLLFFIPVLVQVLILTFLHEFQAVDPLQRLQLILTLQPIALGFVEDAELFGVLGVDLDGLSLFDGDGVGGLPRLLLRVPIQGPPFDRKEVLFLLLDGLLEDLEA